MPIKIPKRLPAFDVLKQEGVYVMSQKTAEHQDIRPIQIGLINLMPKKIQTEIQFARLIGATPLQIELTLIRMTEHHSKNTSADHMEAFYTTFDQARTRHFDGLIITGAPIEQLPYQEVTYWEELVEVFAWTKKHVHSTMAVCWGAMAMLYHFFGIQKKTLKQKAFGCYSHSIRQPTSPYLRGFSDELMIPTSRWTTISRADVKKQPELQILIDVSQNLARADNADDVDADNVDQVKSAPPNPSHLASHLGPCLIEDKTHRALYMINHLEYDSDTLKQEYDRDCLEDVPIQIPENYFPNDNTQQNPLNRWRHHGHLLYGNWINQIYQTTRYDINSIGSDI